MTCDEPLTSFLTTGYHAFVEEFGLAEINRWKILYLDKSLLFLKPAHLPWMEVEPNKAYNFPALN